MREELIQVSVSRGGFTNPRAQTLLPCTQPPTGALPFPVWGPDSMEVRETIENSLKILSKYKVDTQCVIIDMHMYLYTYMHMYTL
jgi:hypothetical protein